MKGMAAMSDIYVLIEHLQGKVSEISYICAAAANVAAKAAGVKSVGILLGNGASALGSDIALDEILYCEHEDLEEFTFDAYLKAMTSILSDRTPAVFIFGDTSIGSGVAASLSISLQIPLVNACQRITASNGALQFESRAYGGKMIANGELVQPTTLVCMIPGVYKPDEGRTTSPPPVTPIDSPRLEDLRLRLVEYVEPVVEDVDIRRERILVAVGRGIQREDNLELAESLAQALGGVVCASRPVVDQGWLSTSRMVGKSGQSVSPALYLALGISGAPEHVEGMADSDLIIAVNTDQTAPIFDIANYGVNLDLLDLLPALTEKVQETKGG
jgi:electron transfer flavoprotein alpha subunit